MSVIGVISVRLLTGSNGTGGLTVIFPVLIVYPQNELSCFGIIQYLGTFQIDFLMIFLLQYQLCFDPDLFHRRIHRQNVISKFPVNQILRAIAADIIILAPVFSIPVEILSVFQNTSTVCMYSLSVTVFPDCSVFQKISICHVSFSLLHLN